MSAAAAPTFGEAVESAPGIPGTAPAVDELLVDLGADVALAHAAYSGAPAPAPDRALYIVRRP